MQAGDSEDGSGVLRRLIRARDRTEAGAGRAPQLPLPVPQTPARAAATAVGRVADRLYALPLQPTSVTPGGMTLAELPELLPEASLLVVLQGPGDTLGMIALSVDVVMALIEVQTLGRVTARPLERRRLTRADAMICADFVNALMTELGVDLNGLDGFEGVSGFRYATYLDDPRPLSLMLEDRPYRSLDFRLRMGGAQTREGTILLALPLAAAARPPKPVAALPVPPAGQPATRLASLGPNVQDAPVELIGVLCRRRMTLGELRSLKPGSVVSLNRVNLAEARIETPDGQLVAWGKFGEADGCHALRLRDPTQSPQPASTPASAPDPVAHAHVDLMAAAMSVTDPDPFRQGAIGSDSRGGTGASEVA